MKLLTYGTLQRGHGNNRLLEKATYLGDAVVSGFRLCYSHGRGSFPYAIPSIATEKVKGEVWDLGEDQGSLNRIDSLEGHPNWYLRTPVKTEDGQDVELYVMNRSYDGLEACPMNEDNQYQWQR